MPRALRLVPLGIAVVLTQVSLFPQLRMLGVVPDLGLVAALAVAWFDGPEAGAWFGFAVGLGFDLFLATPVGLSAISYALVAYALGTIRPMFDGRVGWLTLGFGFAGGLAGGILFAIFAILTGTDQLQQLHTVAVVVNSALYDALLAPLMFGLLALITPSPTRFN
ncbi:MAG TPA: rod shape-determining protein MreD [Acidimicrobiia bacterium]|jgi:rod shape-determining protein MreD